MKLWIDSTCPPPIGYWHLYSVNQAKNFIMLCEVCDSNTFSLYDNTYRVKVIDIGYEAGNYTEDGGEYIELLKWLEKSGRNYPIHIHSINPVGVANMRKIIQKNGWREI